MTHTGFVRRASLGQRTAEAAINENITAGVSHDARDAHSGTFTNQHICDVCMDCIWIYICKNY